LREARPQGIRPTIKPAGAGAPARVYLVTVPALYRGVQRLLRAVLTDEDQLPGAEQLADALVQFLSPPD
jgi:hypothetical protein